MRPVANMILIHIIAHCALLLCTVIGFANIFTFSKDVRSHVKNCYFYRKYRTENERFQFNIKKRLET